MPLRITSHIVYPKAVPKKPEARNALTAGPDSIEHCKPWTAQDDAIVLKCYRAEGRAKLAKKLGRSINAIKMRAQKLGVVEKRA